MDMSSVAQQSSALWPDPAADVPNDHLRCNMKHTTHAQKEECARARKVLRKQEIRSVPVPRRRPAP